MLQLHSFEEWVEALKKHYPDQFHGSYTADRSAEIHYNCQLELWKKRGNLSESSEKRIDHFFDEFIRSEYVQNLTSERDSDFINEPERAERCYDAAEYGCDGKTHAEVIQDWRDAFTCWLRDRQGPWKEHNRFEQAVRNRIEECELWHYFNGSLYQEIG